MRDRSAYCCTCYACEQPIEIPEGVTTCPKCGAELRLEWRQAVEPRPQAPTISDKDGLR